MKKLLWAFVLITLVGCKESGKTTVEPENQTTEATNDKDINFEITPISHATMMLEWDGTTIYIDPVGDSLSFEKYPPADFIFVTDIHGDHLNINTISGIKTDATKIIVPQAVADKMPIDYTNQLNILNNSERTDYRGFTTTAIPMYNLREEALKFHPKGRGNGYVIEKNGMRVYISGDTEDIPEMRNLQDIDVAFVCMNLPYTMTVESAASAVLDFKPKKIYPYHYRGTEGKSDVAKFKDIVTAKNDTIEVIQLNWYPVE